jgi:hypothetical protein
MELQALTGQRFIGAGDARDDGQASKPIAGLLAMAAPPQAARGRQKDQLFIHLTLSGPPEDNSVLTQDVVDAISALFFQTPGSVTAALRRAISESNQRLLRYNVSGAGSPREGALTCAVLRGEELYLVQVGESYALLGHNFGIERLPQSPPSKITPLGRTAGLDMRYVHNWLQPGDMLLLADPRLAHLPAGAFEPALIDVDLEDGLQELAGLVGNDQARVLMVEFTDEGPGLVPNAGRSRSFEVSRQLPPPTTSPIREGLVVPGAGARNEAGAGPGIDVEVVETQARKVTSRAALGLSGLAAWLADLLSIIHSPNSRNEESGGWAIPALLAVIIPVIVAVVVGAVYIQRGNVVQLSELEAAMRQRASDAQVEADPEQARQLYQDVLSLAAQAAELGPVSAEINLLRQSAVNALDQTAGVARLQGQRIASFGAEAALTAVSLEGEANEAVYVLDMADDIAYRQAGGPDFRGPDLPVPEVILVGEQVIGSHVTGQMLDTEWRPKGNNTQRDGLAVLDRRGALISFYPSFQDVRAVPLGLASDWQDPRTITFFSERLYVLDPGAGRIWRYFADGEGFIVTEDQRYIELPDEADLANVVDFAIVSRDGSVILLYYDGRMREYAGEALLWSENDLADFGLDQPMIAPVAIKIVGSGLNSSVFVADPGSARILQFSVGGTFLAQYKAFDTQGAELFARASDFAIMETPLRVLVAAGNELYLATRE